jgi:nucleotide-binding universal stress UspA family protein
MSFKVMVALDGSRVAEHSLVYLDALAAMGDLSVRLVSVVEPWTGTQSPDSEEFKQREHNLLATYLREVASDLKKHARMEVEQCLMEGNPAQCLLNEARAFPPDVLIISTHGRSGPSRWRIGSVADKVIRGAVCDVLVVGPKATEHERWLEATVERPFRSILVPLDGSKTAELAIGRAASLAKVFASTLHLVQAITPPVVADISGSGMAYGPEVTRDMTEGSESYLTSVAFRLGSGLGVKKKVLFGGAATVLAEYASDNGLDLVVMTTHGRGGIMRLALGSVTDRMLASGTAPVWVVRSPSLDALG